MSLLSSFIRNQLLKVVEQEIAEHAPEAKQVAIEQMKAFGEEVVEWAEKKLNADINGDGQIGG